MSITPRSILSSALVGESPYNQAERILEKLDAAGWEIVRKPRIPEPGLWGVVEAGCQDCTPRKWVRTEEHWYAADGDLARYWNALVDPVLVRDGV